MIYVEYAQTVLFNGFSSMIHKNNHFPNARQKNRFDQGYKMGPYLSLKSAFSKSWFSDLFMPPASREKFSEFFWRRIRDQRPRIILEKWIGKSKLNFLGLGATLYETKPDN